MHFCFKQLWGARGKFLNFLELEGFGILIFIYIESTGEEISFGLA